MKKLSLIEMIQFAILSEGRAEDVLRKYENQGVTKEIIDKFVQGQNDIDPAINNKYLEWMVQQYLNNKNTNEIINAVNTWHKNLNKIDSTLISNHYPDWTTNKELLLIAKNPKDINSYKTLDVLQNIGRYAEKKLSKNEEEKIIKAETRLVYDDDNFQIRVPLSYQASCKYGAGTAWCTRLPDTDNYFKKYSEHSILFYVIDKKMSSRPEHPMFKVAVQMNKESGNVNIWNSRDTNVGSDMDYFFPPEMVKAMNEYRLKYIVDYGRIIDEINKTAAEMAINIGDWSKTSDGPFMLTNGIYFIIPAFELKNKRIVFQLIKEATVIDKTNFEIPSLYIKEIEDIAIEHNYNQDLIYKWLENIFKYIETTWDTIMEKFDRLIDYNNIHDMIEDKINDRLFVGGWDFTPVRIPNDNNYTSEFVSIRNIDEYTYVLTIIIDFNKNNFILRAEEKQNDTDERGYNDQVMPFDPNLLNDQQLFLKKFLNWENFVLTLILPEEMEEAPEFSDLTLNDFAGTYKSPMYGNFTAELINGDELHLKSDRMRSHNVMTTVDQFRYVMHKLELKKVK